MCVTERERERESERARRERIVGYRVRRQGECHLFLRERDRFLYSEALLNVYIFVSVIQLVEEETVSPQIINLVVKRS